ncbi:hypothetical protein [Capnocytophaga gingivalis]|jgi:hypothetical protein
MTTKLTHAYFGTLDTSKMEELEDNSYDVLWEQEIPYKDSIVWVSFWFSKGNDLLKERLDAFESFIKKLSMREEEARKALIQYLKEHPDYFNHFKEKTKKAPNDIETFVDELELDMIDFWYPQEEEADIDIYFAPYYEDDAETEEVLSVQFALSGEILSIDWDS